MKYLHGFYLLIFVQQLIYSQDSTITIVSETKTGFDFGIQHGIAFSNFHGNARNNKFLK